jgi:tetrahydromethanopterin:alpha-L-glutamate ligase
MIELALRAAAATGAYFAGVDMIRDGGDALQVLEVNSMPGWRGLQKVIPFSIADRLVKNLLDRIGREGARAAG